MRTRSQKSARNSSAHTVEKDGYESKMYFLSAGVLVPKLFALNTNKVEYYIDYYRVFKNIICNLGKEFNRIGKYTLTPSIFLQNQVESFLDRQNPLKIVQIFTI